MTRHLFLIAGALMALANPAWPAPLVVRSGEHPGFSRLVVPTGAEGSWRMGRTPGGYGVDLGVPAPQIDLSQAFARIPRDRLADLRYDDAAGRLLLTVACECYARAFATDQSPAELVIDILDGPPPGDSLLEQPLDPGTPRRRQQGARIETVYRSRVGRDIFLDRYWSQDSMALPAAGLRPPPDAPVPPIFDTGALAKTLTDELARAAAQGLVDPVLRPAVGAEQIAAAARDGGPADRSPTPMAMAPATVPAPPPASPQIRLTAETAVDRDSPAYALAAPTDSGVRACIPDQSLDILAWGGTGTAADALSRLNRGVLLEFDRPDPAVATQLVRLYLYLGWGAEARAAADAFAADAADRDLWLALAELLDEGTDSAGVFSGMAACAGDAALWATLAAAPDTGNEAAGDAGGGTAKGDARAVRRAFARLPPHLRRYLAEPLARRFLEAGDDETAMALRNAVVRLNAGKTVPSLAVADLALRDDDRPEATATLRRLIRSNGPDAPAALIRIVEMALAAQEVPAASDVTALAAMAYEHRATPLGAGLTAAHARAVAATGDAAMAFAIADTLPDPGPPDSRRAVEMALVESLERTGDDAMFASLLQRRAAQIGGMAADEQTLRSIIERAGRLGMNEAVALLTAGRAGDGRIDAPLDRARIAAARGESRVVLDLLSDLPDSPSAELRAEAHERLGQWGPAADAWVQARQPDRAAAAQWRAGRWAEIAATGQPSAALAAPLRAAAALGSAGPAAPPAAPTAAPGDPSPLDGDLPGPAPLAAAAARVAESREARQTILALLATTAIDPPAAAAKGAPDAATTARRP